MIRWLPICFVWLVFTAQAQPNLIQNGSFEEYFACPQGQGGIPVNYLKYWYSPSKNTPDYFNVCSVDPSVQIPENMFGFQYSNSGNGYGGAGLYWALDGREYLTNKLINTLKHDSLYCLTFYINAAEDLTYSTYLDKIGIYFSLDSIYFDTYVNLPVIPQLETQAGEFFTDTINWQKVEFEYTALGGEQYVTIGNFRDNANTDTIKIRPLGNASYYYFDNFSLIECNPSPPPKEIIIPNVFTSNGDQLNETFTIENLPDNSAIIIYSRWGNQVYQSNNYKNDWDGENHSSGVYYYILTLPNGVVKKGAVTILR